MVDALELSENARLSAMQQTADEIDGLDITTSRGADGGLTANVHIDQGRFRDAVGDLTDNVRGSMHDAVFDMSNFSDGLRMNGAANQMDRMAQDMQDLMDRAARDFCQYDGDSVTVAGNAALNSYFNGHSTATAPAADGSAPDVNNDPDLVTRVDVSCSP